MDTVQYAAKIIEELQHSVSFIQEAEADRLVDRLLQADKVFVAGAGRSGLMAKSFAMRLMQMGHNAYVVGETVTPSIGKNDVLVIGSGSGETKALVSMAQKAKTLDAGVALVTISPESAIGKLADVIVRLPGSPKDKELSRYNTIQPMASLFEQTLLIFYDAVILKCMERKGITNSEMYGRHANLE
ncbi:6-phospho-3-hexuloisomerase [Paenibacillus macerans]|uniref:6-phospho-3-hexuloisomerase n=1 Tax=Paenibacillus macerans TaxID=44252 RepID=UPI002DB7CBC6|nr:6-phospho-3-hexuloisomerase [Paenibacillus macerans]MEC0329572.1 6-phospho-3-hexuloisomerase [Paenibacillus macerans]